MSDASPKVMSALILREHGPAETLISDVWIPELSENKFLMFWVKKFVVIYYGSFRELKN